jgi:hypothetical protein
MKRIAASLTLLLIIGAPRTIALAQADSGPITRDELIKLIKESGPHPLKSQGDIAAEVGRRGVAFKLDEKTLDELKKAGAKAFLIESIERSTEAAGRAIATPNDRESPQTGTLDDSLIEETRRHARAYIRELPNFVVKQQITCKVRSPQTQGKWQTQTTLEIEMTYENPRTSPNEREWTYEQVTGESKKLIKVDGKATTKSLRDLSVMTSAGEFGAVLMIPFSRDGAIFKEDKHETLRGRDTVTYDFTATRRSVVVDPKRPGTQPWVVAKSSGRVWIDPDTKRVMRIESSQEGMPPEKQLTLWEITVDYDWVTIEDHKYLLPIHAEVLAGFDAQKTYGWNVIEFINYHKWEGKIKIVPDSR